MKKLLSYWIYLPLFFIFAACSDNNDEIERIYVNVGTPQISATTTNSITLTASVTGGGNQIIKKGFCYSSNSQTPDIKGDTTDADDNFSATISGLRSNGTY